MANGLSLFRPADLYELPLDQNIKCGLSKRYHTADRIVRSNQALQAKWVIQPVLGITTPCHIWNPASAQPPVLLCMLATCTPRHKLWPSQVISRVAEKTFQPEPEPEPTLSALLLMPLVMATDSSAARANSSTRRYTPRLCSVSCHARSCSCASTENMKSKVKYKIHRCPMT